MSHAKVYFSSHTNVREDSEYAARRLGLTGVSEYLRIALEYLVETRSLPEEFKGKRSIIRTGRKPKGAAATARVEGKQ